MEAHAHARISSRPEVCHGKPVIAGTRIPVAQILGALGSGETRESLLANYPTLRPEDIDAAIAFGADLAQFEEVPEVAVK